MRREPTIPYPPERVARAFALGAARPRRAVRAAALVWALILSSVGCGGDADHGVSPAEDQNGNPAAYWYQQGAESKMSMEPSLAPETSRE